MELSHTDPLPGRTVLLVCTGNTCRSPMATAILQRLRPSWILWQGGVEPGVSNGLAGVVLGEMSLPAPPAQGSTWERYRDSQPDAVLVFSEKALKVLQELNPNWPLITMLVSDPAEVRGSREIRLQAYRECARQLARELHQWLELNGW